MEVSVAWVAVFLLLYVFTATAAPAEDCTVLIYTAVTAEPSSMRDTSASCPVDGSVRAFVLDMKEGGTGRPVLKESSPTPLETFHCARDSTCKIVVSGYGLTKGDSLLYFPNPLNGGETSSLCPPPASQRSSIKVARGYGQISTGSSAVFVDEEMPLSSDTTLTLFNLGVVPDGQFVVCYASSLAFRDTTPRSGAFRYFAGLINVGQFDYLCDFETDCGFISFVNNNDMDLEWTLHSGSTETEGTGPQHDHTKGPDGNGTYLYMKSPGYAVGSAATQLTKPAIYPRGTYCAKLAFHMYGDDVNSLRIYIHELTDGKPITGDWGLPKWIRVGDHGREWEEGGFEFTSDGSTPSQFVFEALAGFSEKGDIAIDDFSLTAGKCPADLMKNEYNKDYICGEVRLISGNWSTDKSWFVKGAVSCSGRGYSFNQLTGGWVPCCVSSYGDYTLVLKDQFGDGWDGSKVEFRFFDKIMTFGEDFKKEDGHEKEYQMQIGLLKIVRAEGSEERIGLELQVMMPQAFVFCGAAPAGSQPPSAAVLKRYGIRSSESTGPSGGSVRMAIQNGEVDVAKMLKANTDYDVYCYAQSAAADLGTDFLGGAYTGDGPMKMDDSQVARSRVTVTTDATPPEITVSEVTEDVDRCKVDFSVSEEATVWCFATEMADDVEIPVAGLIKAKGTKQHLNSGKGSLTVAKLMPDTTYDLHCHAEDTAKPKPNGISAQAIATTHHQFETPAKPPQLKIKSYKTFAKGFAILVEVNTPGKVWCGAAMAGSPYPKKEDVRRVGATATVDDITKPVELEIRGVPPNTRYTVYCFASSRSGSSEMTDSQMWETALEVGSFGKFCEQPTEPKTVDEGENTPFDPITPSEEFLVKDYMLSRRELHLDGVYRITLYTDKEAVVNYLDKNGPFPKRYARVRVGTCQMGQGHYDQYKVGPLDGGNQRELTYTKVADTVLTDCGGYTPQGVFGRRLMDLHHDEELSTLMKQSFGYSFGNVDECQDMTKKLCLDYGPVIYEKNGTHNNAWVGLKTPDGDHVPFYFIFKAPDLDMSNPNDPKVKNYLSHHLQHVDGFWYDGRTFGNMDDLLSEYSNNESIRLTPSLFAERLLQLEKETARRREEELTKHTVIAKRRLAPGPSPLGRGDLEYRLAPEHIEPQGKRFTIRSSPGVESYTIKYAGWEFVINNDRDTSLRLWNVRFNQDRVAYEMGLMEALAHYSVAERNWYFLDSWYGGLGAAARKLHKGVECPRSGETIFWDESVCVFEQDMARPLRSHWKSGELRDGAPHLALVVRQMLTVSNYDYITDWTFHLSGVMEGTVSFTGELYAGVEVPWFSSRQTMFGTQVTGSMRMGALHNHIAVWKIDFDVDGEYKDNSVHFKEVVADPVRPGAHTLKSWYAEKEMDAAWLFNGTRALHYFVVNENHHVYGNVGGYLVKPRQTLAIQQPDFEVYSGPAAWAKYRVFSHIRKDGELDSTLPRDNKYASRPATDVDRYIEDNEVIRHVDVVTWVSDGIWHVPLIEDMPLTVSIGNTLGWMVKPANFYTEDPSMDLHNAIAGDIKDPGTCAIIRSDLKA